MDPTPTPSYSLRMAQVKQRQQEPLAKYLISQGLSPWEACVSGDVAKLQEACDMGATASLLSQDGTFRSLMSIAAAHEQIAVMNYLYEQGADVNDDGLGFSILSALIQHTKDASRNVDVSCNWLIDHGANPRTLCRKKSSAFEACAKIGTPELMLRLLSSLPPEEEHRSFDALYTSIQMSNRTVSDAILAHYPNIFHMPERFDNIVQIVAWTGDLPLLTQTLPLMEATHQRPYAFTRDVLLSAISHKYPLVCEFFLSRIEAEFSPDPHLYFKLFEAISISRREFQHTTADAFIGVVKTVLTYAPAALDIKTLLTFSHSFVAPADQTRLVAIFSDHTESCIAKEQSAQITEALSDKPRPTLSPKTRI